MEPIQSSETSAYNNTLTPGTYPKEKKLQSKHGESLKSRIILECFLKKSIGLAQDKLVSFCESGYETLEFIKCGEFFFSNRGGGNYLLRSCNV